MKLGLVIDLDTCVGCHACAVACKQWNTSGTTGPLSDLEDEQLPESQRQPVCVLTCPTSARMFGDFDDPESDVSRAVAERGGVAQMPELGYAPVNRYLPPREKPEVTVSDETRGESTAGGAAGLIGKWMKRQKDSFDRFGKRTGGES